MSLKKTSRNANGWKRLWTFLRELTKNKLLMRLLVLLISEMIRAHYHGHYH